MADGSAPVVDARARLLPWVVFDYDPGNPRRSTPEEEIDLTDLLGPIRLRGILAPLLVERRGERYLVVDGERRHRAAGAVGRLEDVPAIVLDDLDDEARLELQIASYARAPMSPLAEARAFKRLLDAFSPGFAVTPSDIADRLGVPVATVKRRLALLSLVPAGQDLLAAGKLTLGLAQETAGHSIAAQSALVAGYELILSAHPTRAPLRRGDVADLFTSQNRRLDLAPFDLTDATLPGGACSACPKKSSAQAVLFEEVPVGELCLDKGCYDKKREAWADRRDDEIAEREVGKGRAAKGKEARESAFKPPKPGPAPKTPEPPGTVAPKGSGGERAKTARAEHDDEIDRQVRRLLDRVERTGLDTPTLLALVIRVVSEDALSRVAARRGLDGDPRKALLGSVARYEEEHDLDPLDGMLAELLACHDADDPAEDGPWALALRWLGPEKPAEKPAPKPPAPREGAKGVPPCTCKPGRGPHGKSCPVKTPKASAERLPNVTPAGAKEDAAGDVRATSPRQTSIPGSGPLCPLTAAHVAALAAEAKIDDPHPGACSPENVWRCVRKVLDLVEEAHPAAVSRKGAWTALSTFGDDCVDLALEFLDRAGILTCDQSTGPSMFRLAPFEGVRSGPTPLPDPAVVFSPASTAPETVQLAGEERKATEARSCPKCKAKAGKVCISGKGKLGTGWFHTERAQLPVPAHTVDADSGRIELRPPKAPPAEHAPRKCVGCGCTDGGACQDDHPTSEAGECTWEELAGANICSVCLRCAESALKLCAKKQAPSAVVKALTVAQKGPKAPEVWGKDRAAGVLDHLEKTGALGRTVDKKLLAAQAAAEST